MSCNGCRVLRKGCSESCVLRPCLQWIDTPESQAHATVFVAKFFGRAGLMSFISNVPPPQRPPLFQSLLYEACGRTVNPVTGAVGLLWSGNWHVCQAAVDTVLGGGTLRPIPDFLTTAPPPHPPTATSDDASDVVCPTWPNHHPPPTILQDLNSTNTTTTYSQSQSPPPPRFSNSKRRKADSDRLHLSLAAERRPGTPSEESATTQSGGLDHYHHQPRLLNLFV